MRSRPADARPVRTVFRPGKLISGAKQILIITAASDRLLINYLIFEANGETPVAAGGLHGCEFAPLLVRADEKPQFIARAN